MGEYEVELMPSGFGLWTYRLFLDGEKVTAFPLSMKLYGSRNAVLEAAKRDAQAHREQCLPRRVPIKLD